MRTGVLEVQRKLMVDALKTDVIDGVTGASVALYKNQPAGDPFDVLAHFTEADFVGYARLTGVTGWTTYRDQAAGDHYLQCTSVLSFSAGVILASQTVYGAIVTDDGFATLKGYAVFDTPFTFARNGDTLDLAIRFKLPALATDQDVGGQ